MFRGQRTRTGWPGSRTQEQLQSGLESLGDLLYGIEAVCAGTGKQIASRVTPVLIVFVLVHEESMLVLAEGSHDAEGTIAEVVQLPAYAPLESHVIAGAAYVYGILILCRHARVHTLPFLRVVADVFDGEPAGIKVVVVFVCRHFPSILVSCARLKQPDLVGL